MRRSALALVLFLVAGCQSSLTELVVVVDVDTSATTIDTVAIDTLDPAGHATTRTEVVRGDGAVSLPVTLGVVWRGGALQPITLTAHGLAGGTEIVSRRVVTGFVSGETRVVRLDLFAACVGVACDTGETCGANGCVSESIAPGDLPRFDGTVTRAMDAGATDAGPSDAGPSDAGQDDVGPGDAGSDAGPTVDDAAIDAAVVCTTTCMLDHAVAVCTASQTCAIVSCETGYSNCDDMPATGCERSIRTNTDCNGCNLPCSSTAGTTTCADGTCRIDTCSVPMTADCNGQLSDGCEVNLRVDAMHCGTCTHACSTGQRCLAGVCH